MHVEYVTIGGSRRPVSVRTGNTRKAEYCFGLLVWRASLKRAWDDFQAKQAKIVCGCEAGDTQRWGRVDDDTGHGP